MKTFLRESALVLPKRVIEKRQSVAGSFRPLQRDIYRRELLTPHVEMQKIMDASEQNTFFTSAVDTSSNFILGEGINFKSDDKFSKEMVENYWKSLDADLALKDAIAKAVLTGNGYFEKDYFDTRLTNGVLVPKKIYPITDPSQMYVNCDIYGRPHKRPSIKTLANGELLKEEVDNWEEFYIQRLNPNFRHPQARYWNISYFGGGYHTDTKLQVYGIPLDGRKVTHFKLMYGATSIYGRSPLAAALNDHEMLFEMERALATIAKYKAVPRKIWQYGDHNLPASEDEVDELVIYLETLDAEDDVIVNKPIATTDLSYAGKEINLDYAINHIKRKMIAGISLDFLSGMGQDVNRATAQQELLAFILSIYAKRKIFLKVIQEEIINPYIKWKNLKPVDAIFTELDFETKNEKEGRIRSNWQSNMLTFNEMREQLGLPKFEDNRQDAGNVGDMLFNEVQMKQSPMSGGMDFGQQPDMTAPQESDAGSLGDAITAPTSESSIVKERAAVIDPTGTAKYQNSLAIGIRNIFKQKLDLIMQSLNQHKTATESMIKTEASLGINVLEAVMASTEGLDQDMKQLVKDTLQKVWMKANDVVSAIAKRKVVGDVRVMQALQTNAFGFIKKHDEDMRTKLRMILTEGVSQGDSISSISKEIKESFGLTSSKSELIARTEVIRTYTQASYHSMKEAGIKRYKWITAGDNRVCLKHCLPKNGKVYNMGEGPLPPEHPNCRCDIQAVPNYEFVEKESLNTEEIIMPRVVEESVSVDELAEAVNMFKKKISYKTMIDCYKKVLENPIEISIFYKVKEQPQKKVTISFAYNNIMVFAEITIKELIEESGIKKFKNDKERQEIEERLWRVFEVKYLQHAILEED